MPSAEFTKKILKAVDEGFDQQIEFTTDLTRIPSMRGQEATAQDFMAAAYRERGYAVDRWRIDVDDIKDMRGFSPVTVSYEDAWNVVGAHRPSDPKGKSLILNGHIDVVPTGPRDLWTHPPFAPRVEKGWLYGRGSGDMKAGLAINLFAMDALRRTGYQPAANVFLQSVVEEECTGNGALACLQKGYRADAAIIPEPSEEVVSLAQVGVMWFQVRVRGRPAHAALAGTGANAIESCFPIIQALHGLEAEWNANKHPAFEHVEHPINFVLSGIEGGDWTSSVPSWCTFDMRISLYPGVDLADVREQVEATVRSVSLHDPFLSNHPPEIHYHGFQAEGYILEGGEEAHALLDTCHRSVTGHALHGASFTATTDARSVGLYADIPALVYGPTAVNIHGFDERVKLDSVRRVTQALALFVADWCGLESCA